MLFVGANAVEILPISPGQLDVGKHRIAVEEEFRFDSGGDRSQPAGAGNVGENVGFGNGLFGDSLVGYAVVFAVRLVPVNPSVAHVEFPHNPVQIAHVMRAIGTWLLL